MLVNVRNRPYIVRSKRTNHQSAHLLYGQKIGRRANENRRRLNPGNERSDRPHTANRHAVNRKGRTVAFRILR